ncbi:MAG TPA: helix-turn-helix transcriptional regulator [Patescibacteria group bacterium]
MPTLRSLREENYISRKKLALLSGVSDSTIVRIEEGKTHTNEETAIKVVEALGKAIGQNLTIENIEGLKLYNAMRDRKQKPKEDNPAA